MKYTLRRPVQAVAPTFRDTRSEFYGRWYVVAADPNGTRYLRSDGVIRSAVIDSSNPSGWFATEEEANEARTKYLEGSEHGTLERLRAEHTLMRAMLTELLDLRGRVDYPSELSDRVEEFLESTNGS